MGSYELLADAIIGQAISDYRSARRALARYPNDRTPERTIYEVEQFFCSDYGEMLTSVKGSVIVEMLRNEKLKFRKGCEPK